MSFPFLPASIFFPYELTSYLSLVLFVSSFSCLPITCVSLLSLSYIPNQYKHTHTLSLSLSFLSLCHTLLSQTGAFGKAEWGIRANIRIIFILPSCKINKNENIFCLKNGPMKSLALMHRNCSVTRCWNKK